MRGNIIKLWTVILLFYAVGLAIGEFTPKITVNKYEAPTNAISYFDDSSSILLIRNEKLLVSHDDGVTWNNVKEIKDETIAKFEIDPFNKERAFVLTMNETHFITNDQGKTWTKFEISNDEKSNDQSTLVDVLFNAENKDLVLFKVATCAYNPPACTYKYYYTTDGFKTSPKSLNVDADICMFAKSSKSFKYGKPETIYCSKNKLNSFGHAVKSSLLVSDDFFKTSTELGQDFIKSGLIIDIRVEHEFLIVVVQNDKFNSLSKVSLFISKDGKNFNQADLEVNFNYGIITFLESSSSSLFVQVIDVTDVFYSDSLSTIYASDSSGLRFSKLLENVTIFGMNKIQGIDGAWLSNVQADTNHDREDKSLLDSTNGELLYIGEKTQLTFNDGKDWIPLKINNDDSCKASDGCSLHLSGVVEKDGGGKFVTGPTPGILLGVGIKGSYMDHFHNILKMNTWISRDGGATWDFALEEPCIFSFGDQGNIIIAVPMREVPSDQFYYSFDQGKSWKTEKLESSIYPLVLTTTIDGTSTKFILLGLYRKGEDDKRIVQFADIFYTINFSDAFDGKKCGDNDFEEIYPRIIEDKKPLCVYGHKEKFKRRKQDAKCFVDKLFEDIKIYDDPCECTEQDYECAPGFISEKNACIPDKKQISRLCESSKSKKISLPDKVLISGNKCKMGKKSIKDFVSETHIKCSDYLEHEKDGKHKGKNKDSKHKIMVKLNKFDGELHQYSYIEKGENVIVKTKDNRIYISNNGGASFNELPIPDEIVAFYLGYIPGQVVLITNTETIYVTHKWGDGFSTVKAPSKPNMSGIKAVSFHKTDYNKFIWYGSQNCDNSFSSDCKIEAYVTRDGGVSFSDLKQGVRSCDFVGAFFDNDKNDDQDLIYCSVEDKTSGKLQLLSSNDYFETSKVVFDNIVGYAITGNFVVVATIDEEIQSLKAKVTVDGQIFADADFPPDFHVKYQQAYTILDSQSKAIFMHVTTNPAEGHEYGSILKSNSNGTSYVLSLDHVNRNRIGYVDYDRIESIEGVIIANAVHNYNSKDAKKLKTQITHNDGGEWSYLTPPVVNSKGVKYKCIGESLSKCSLNLHGFTERADYRDTFSSASATGLLFGVGNVGETLESYDKGSTFMSRDGGITWKEIKHGVYMWEYGDRGTILVLVNAKEETDKLLYSLDEGNTWHGYKFAKEPIKVLDLATVPTDTSRRFLIFGHTSQNHKATLSYSIDFTNVHKRQCQLDLDNPENDDYEYWSPKHPKLPDNCLFGHEVKYLRRAIGHDDCFIGSAPLEEGFKVIRNCSCTRRDYECDYNYYRDTDDTCKLVKGLSPSDRKNEICKKENTFQYFEPTGYRKIPLSTCVGGKSFDHWNAKPCPGKEKEFNEHYGNEIKGNKLFFVIAIPVFVFIFATWFVYDRGIRRNGGFKRFGQIRLDLEEDDFHPIEDNDIDKAVNKIVKGGILVVAAAIAGFKTLRKIDKLLLDKITSTVFRRSPGQRNYVQVPNIDEEEELFGNFHDNYEDELDAENNLGHDYTDNNNGEDLNVFNEEHNIDSRLFNIADQSDEESHSNNS